MSDLPPGWATAPLGALLTELRNGVFVSRPGNEDTGRPILRISAVRPMVLRDDDVRYVPKTADVNGAESFYLSEGDLLFTRYSGNPEYVGACARVRQHLPDTLYPDKLIRGRVIPGVVHPGYLEAIMSAPQTREVIRRLVKTTAGQVGISGTSLRSIPVPVAPYAEQLRIVAAIEEQFSRLDAGVMTLERIRTKLYALRSSCVDRAVDEAVRLIRGESAPVARLLEIPLANGRSVPNGGLDGYPVLRLTAIRGQQVDVSQSKAGAWTADEARPYRIFRGDFLVARGNGTRSLVGRGSMVTADADVAFPDTMIRMRFDKQIIIPEYAALMWGSRPVRIQIENSARTTAGIYKINQKDLQSIRLPVPDIRSQRIILESSLSAFDAIRPVESVVATQLKRAEKLRSSILSAAFSGKLTSQGVSA